MHGHVDTDFAPVGVGASAPIVRPDALRRASARIRRLRAVALLQLSGRRPRARLLLPLTTAALPALAVSAGVVRACDLAVREIVYRHVVVLPLDYRTTGEASRSVDPLEASPIGRWLARIPHYRTRTDLRFACPGQAEYCASQLAGSFRL